jgi:long-chain acyl-CoA synthetase
VEVRGDRPAIREKKFGIWQPTSWREWLQISKDIAYGLHASGFRPGDVASIIANAVPEWVYADMGILCAGGVSSGIYPTDSSVQVEYLINDSSTKVIFAEDEEQLDKILSCRSRCPTLQKIVVFDMEGLSGFTDPMVLSLAEFMALGRNHEQGQRSAVGRDDREPQAQAISPSSSTRPARRARPRARCIPTAA